MLPMGGGPVVQEVELPRVATRAPRHLAPPKVTSRSRRRFTIATLVAMAVSAVPYMWVLWGVGSGSGSQLNAGGASTGKFYDLQARAMFAGHLHVPRGSLGIEAFIHDGRTYTYFGLFPSILRMPVLVFTHYFDGHLTAPSMTLAWIVTGVCSAMLIWRVRFLVRGPVAMGVGEAWSLGMLLVVILSGSVLVFLASSPQVYSEDLAWSVALTVGSLFALLGVLERPSWGRVSAAGLVIGAAMLTRSTTGWACVIGALLVAGWFALGRGGAPNRRWCLPVAAAGLIPLAAGVAVNMAKFGTPFGLPLADQVYTAVNAHRRYFLAANGGKAFSLHFLPSTLVAYFQPGGLRLTPVYPFITLPAGPARVVGRVVMDRTNRTASVTASMPLLFLLGCWGLVTAFRRRPIGRVALTRMILLSATAATVGVLVWGYLDDRYLGDLLPILVVASAVGMCDVWRRLDARRSQGRRFHAQRLVVGTVVLLTVFGIWANVGIASTPTASWSLSEVANYVSLQKSISALTGHPLNDNVVRGTVLPYWAPADQLFIVGDCSGLYISNGESYQAVPKQELQHYTWLPVERGPDVVHIFEMTFRGPHLGRDLPRACPLGDPRNRCREHDHRTVRRPRPRDLQLDRPPPSRRRKGGASRSGPHLQGHHAGRPLPPHRQDHVRLPAGARRRPLCIRARGAHSTPGAYVERVLVGGHDRSSAPDAVVSEPPRRVRTATRTPRTRGLMTTLGRLRAMR